MNKLQDSKTIVGSMVFNLPTKTHQSALRIVQRTSYDKFLAQHGKLNPRQMLSAWMKYLFVTSSSSSELNKLKKYLISELQQTMKDVQEDYPLNIGMKLHVSFVFPWLKGHTKKEREQGIIIKTTKPDVDNLVKVLMDCMETSGLIENDSRFYEITLNKNYGDEPGIYWQITY